MKVSLKRCQSVKATFMIQRREPLLYLYMKYFFLMFTDNKPVEFVNSCRMQHKDFEVVKVIGRGAFGEVQLVCIV